MPYKKLVSTLVGVAACTALVVTDSSAQTSQRNGRRHGGGAITQTAPCVAAPLTFESRTRGFYPEQTHTRWIAPRLVNDTGFRYPRYGHHPYSYNSFDTTDTSDPAATTTISLRQEVDTNVPYGWIHASVPYGHGSAVTDRCYSHGGVRTDTSDGAWPATTTSGR